jgi:hypothetical protein
VQADLFGRELPRVAVPSELSKRGRARRREVQEGRAVW